MIELTKKQLEVFQRRFSFNINDDPVIIATFNMTKLSNDNVIANFSNTNPFKKVIAIKSDDFRYNDNIYSVSCFTNEQGILTQQVQSGLFVYYIHKDSFDFSDTAEYTVVFVFNSGVNPNWGMFTSSMRLISVDFISSVIQEITFPYQISTLKSVCLGDSGAHISGVINGLNIDDTNKLYFSDSHFPYKGGSFRGKRLVLPEAQGLSYEIPDNCFANNTELLEVIIPTSCTGIGAGAFKGCTNLRRVKFFKSLTIGDGAFDGCTYPELNFDVTDAEAGEWKNSRVGCLMYGNGSYLIIKHATSCYFDPDSEYYFANKENNKFLLSNYDGGTGVRYFPSTTEPKIGMYKKSGGRETIEYLNSSGQRLTTTTALLLTKNNIANIKSQYNTIGNGDEFIVPSYFLIHEIESNACRGDVNMQNVILDTMNGLRDICDNAFKNCTQLKNLSLPFEQNWWDGGDRNIGKSAFEGCGIRELVFNSTYVLGERAFYGCTQLETIDSDATNTFVCPISLDENGNNVVEYSYTTHVGNLCFGNTPSLTTITGCNTCGNAILASNQAQHPGDHPIYNNSGTIVLGCKSTNFVTIDSYYNEWSKPLNIAQNAFYGCSGLTGSFNFSYDISKIGQSAFYGCSGITGLSLDSNNTNIYGSAFYACTSLSSLTFGSGEYSIYDRAFYSCTGLNTLTSTNSSTILHLYSQAFGRTGITTLNCKNDRIDLKALDVFDDCIIQNVTMTTAGEQVATTNPVATSSTSVENAFMTKYATSGYPMTLIKGGNSSKTVNNWSSSNGNLYEIRPKAFAGVKYVNNTGNPVVIPNSVTTIGSDIFQNSAINNSSTKARLKLEGQYNPINGVTFNDPNNRGFAILYQIGAKYFKQILMATRGYKAMGSHYYRVENGSSSGINYIELVEYSGANLSTRTVVWRITYVNNGDIIIICYYTVNYDFSKKDRNTHVSLNNTDTIVLAKVKEPFPGVKGTTLLDTNFIPGHAWASGLDIEINVPNDLSVTTSSILKVYSNSDNAFSGTPWVNSVTVARNIYNVKGLFKNCTSLTEVNKIADDWPNKNMTIFNGTVPESMFEGCTSLQTINSVDYPVNFEKGAFKNSGFTNANNELKYALNIGDECFSNTPITTITILGVDTLSSTAFNNNNLGGAVCYGYSGKFFSGRDKSICDSNGFIVVGTSGSAVDRYNGVATNAFKNAKFSFSGVVINGKNSFVIEKSAFSGSKIDSFSEKNCTNTEVGESAFENCTQLRTINFGRGVTFGNGAFKGCTALSSIGVPNNINIPDNCFAGCTSIYSFTNNGEEIGSGAFSGCTGMTSFNGAPHEIKSGAFSGCTRLTSLVFDDYGPNFGELTINPNAFTNCPLATLKGHDGYAQCDKYYVGQYAIYNITDDVEVLLGTNNFNELSRDNNQFKDKIKTIGDYAYQGRGLTGDIVIPNSVTKIGNYAFANNPRLNSVTIPTTVEYIGDHAFDGCTNITYFVLPDSCKYLGTGALSGCSLSRGIICNAVDITTSHGSGDTDASGAIGNSGSFSGSVDFTGCYGITSISEIAFHSTNIAVVHLPSKCTSIGSAAFYDCTKLVELHIYSDGETLTFNANCFNGCVNLKDIYIHGQFNVSFNPTNGNQFYGVGTSVGYGRKVLHVKTGVNISPMLYTALVTNNGFTVEYF